MDVDENYTYEQWQRAEKPMLEVIDSANGSAQLVVELYRIGKEMEEEKRSRALCEAAKLCRLLLDLGRRPTRIVLPSRPRKPI